MEFNLSPVIVSIFIAFFLCLTFSGSQVFSSDDDLTLFINDELQKADMFLEDGRTKIDTQIVERYLDDSFEKEYVQLRDTFEKVGFVSWDSSTSTIEIDIEVSQEEQFISKLEIDKAINHIKALSENIGTRPAGSKNEHQAAEYLKEYYNELGYEVNKQDFSVDYAGPNNMTLGTVTIKDGEKWYGDISYKYEEKEYDWGTYQEWHGTEWEMGASANGKILGEEITGEVVNVKYKDEHFTDDIEDKIALINSDELENTKIAKKAKDNGAKAVILYITGGGRGNLGEAFDPRLEKQLDIPVLGAAKIHGVWLEEMIEVDSEKEQGLEISLNTYQNMDLTSYNVEAIKSAESDDAPIVAITAHYDSVIASPGANDNASGTAATMELARVFKKFDNDVELRFINFGAEEVGLVGSFYYVDQLSKDELERFEGVYNADMIATSDPYIESLFAVTVDGESNSVTENIIEADKRLEHDHTDTGHFAASDHLPFHQAGIDAALFIDMAGEGTPEDYYIEPIYHTPLDTIQDNISQKRLETALEIIGKAVFKESIN
ncbi:M28 family metallopeptidase [Natranaerobius trueperi]|uniref:Aminopeptidase n=1 Tax=Natranaerobius trueperi TaxID=759412 RepID=A0A226BZ92_9FIRM|nr:M28 family metallopeptidase [Natranaerobius trueperi]OWZ83519.1 aminopeptidase [Natranaerobius trueperi]